MEFFPIFVHMKKAVKELRVKINKRLHDRVVQKASGQKRTLSGQVEILLEKGLTKDDREGEGDE